MCSPRPFSAIARLRQTLTLLPAPSPNFPTLVSPQPIIIHHSLSCMIEYARLDKHHHVYQFLGKASSDWLFVTIHSHRHPSLASAPYCFTTLTLILDKMVSFQYVVSYSVVYQMLIHASSGVTVNLIFSSDIPRIKFSLLFLGCNDVVKKPKLDNHRGQCHSTFTCIDCTKTFNGPAEYKSHTSCISEAEKYQKSLYKGPKGVCYLKRCCILQIFQ